jgi:predicted transcriptional regulator
MVNNCVTVPTHISIEDAVRDYFLHYGYGGFPAEEGGRIRGLLSLADVKQIAKEDWPRTSVQAVMSPIDERSTIGADKDIVEALSQMAQSGLGRLVVLDSFENCIGFITHNGILKHLQVQELLKS